jgi:hypothetical protein
LFNRLTGAACAIASAALLAASPAVAATPPRAHAPHGHPRSLAGHRLTARASTVGGFTRGNLYCLAGSRLWIGGPTPGLRGSNQTVRYDANVSWWTGSRWQFWFTTTQYTNSGPLSTDIFSQGLQSWTYTGGMDASGTLLYNVPAGYYYMAQQVLHWYPAAGDPTGADALDYAYAGYGNTSCRAS